MAWSFTEGALDGTSGEWLWLPATDPRLAGSSAGAGVVVGGEAIRS
jgi:hypothetical protein